MPTLYMMIGIPGSGKSYYAKEITEKYENTVIHSSDDLREKMFGDARIQKNPNVVFDILHNRIKRDLVSGKNVVFDATNVSRKHRVSFINHFLKGIDCKKVAVCVMTPYEDCLYQNANRERKVPEDVIKRMYLRYNVPDYSEGFDAIEFKYHFVNTYQCDYTIDEFLYGKINACTIDQDNPWHTATIGDHCLKAARYISTNYPNRKYLYAAAMLHDIGKPFTKSRIKQDGTFDIVSHYYNHQNCGCYDSLFYLEYIGLDVKDKVYISNLILQHMRPFLVWNEDENKREKDRKNFDPEFFEDLIRLHAADLAAD